jgi:low temperature requirement protein LtrA
MVSAWFYRHLPLTLGIAAVGAVVFNVLAHFGEHRPSEVRWLLVAAIFFAFRVWIEMLDQADRSL